MSHRLKLTFFVLAFNVIGFAEGHLLPDLGLVWLISIFMVASLVGVLGVLGPRWYRLAARRTPLESVGRA